ncbi:DUF4232 domain-containing protein [Gluconobacter morbifer]|uniref:DUF4232 domain-containing protein n=1 Tax=Gluconobacter morbifer G707 TaxID=1088869 RepID=G6XK34_9PROT|nr:DUF4232 domain-containing protein [Gluconobacter morbifer]EHH67996.1 hypothetical protein GMO_17630 [Gluconobacter morbifer G707]
MAGILALPCVASAPVPAPVRLSPAEENLIASKVNAIADPAERRAVQEQGLPWMATTFLCQDAARPVLAGIGSAPHRFFLQDDQPDSQRIVTPSLLQGRGQFLNSGDGPIHWTAFTWSCHLDPATGRVARFDAVPAGKSQPFPECRVSQMTLRTDDENGAFDGMSQSGTRIILHNSGPAACVMSSLPRLYLEDGAGHVLHSRSGASAQKQVVIRPNGTVTASLHWVSGDVYPEGRCVTSSRMVMDMRGGHLQQAFERHLCVGACGDVFRSDAPDGKIGFPKSLSGVCWSVAVWRSKENLMFRKRT